MCSVSYAFENGSEHSLLLHPPAATTLVSAKPGLQIFQCYSIKTPLFFFFTSTNCHFITHSLLCFYDNGTALSPC